MPSSSLKSMATITSPPWASMAAAPPGRSGAGAADNARQLGGRAPWDGGQGNSDASGRRGGVFTAAGRALRWGGCRVLPGVRAQAAGVGRVVRFCTATSIKKTFSCHGGAVRGSRGAQLNRAGPSRSRPATRRPGRPWNGRHAQPRATARRAADRCWAAPGGSRPALRPTPSRPPAATGARGGGQPAALRDPRPVPSSGRGALTRWGRAARSARV